jgi:hypothetical protein
MGANGKIFTEAFNNDEVPEITYNPNWANQTGYLDYAVKGDNAPVLAAGQMVKTRDPRGRRIILIGTRKGNVAVFDRYSGQTEMGTWVTNAPRTPIFQTLLSGSAVGEAEMVTLVGGWGNIQQNIGFTIEAIAHELHGC